MTLASTLTQTLVGVWSNDMVIEKKEKIDMERLSFLLSNPDVPKETKRELKKLNEKISEGCWAKITYKLGKQAKESSEPLGRLNASENIGLQGLKRDVRNFLANRNYFDIDMVSAHPSLCVALCRKQNLTNTYQTELIDKREEKLTELMDALDCSRSTAKDYITALYFGEENVSYALPQWFKSLHLEISNARKVITQNDEWTDALKFLNGKRKNRIGSAFAFLLQSIERACLIVLEKSAKKNGRSLDSYIHDGGLVQRHEGEEVFPEELLRKFEKDIEAETGFSIRLASKPMETSWVMTEKNDELIDPITLINDSFAAIQFAKLCGTNIVLDTGVVWVFETTTGMWSCEEDVIKRMVTQCGRKLIFKQMGSDGIKVYDYSGSVKNTKNLMIKLPDILERQNGFFHTRIASDVGKILFPDGIYDFKTGEFVEQFDSNIVFRYAMPRKFPRKEMEKIAELEKLIFTDAFADQDHASTLRHSLMRAAIGDYKRRVMTVGLGLTASGKGSLATLVKNSFGDYCASFNGNSMIGKSYDTESSRELTWVMDIASRRFAMSSEIKTRNEDGKRASIAIDGNMLKTVVSGGTDFIQACKKYENDKTIMNKSTLFMFAQDLPAIDPPDDAVRDRLRVCEWSYSYVDEPKKPYEKKRDRSILEKLADPDYGDAFFWLMVREYEDWKQKNFVEPARAEVELQARAELIKEVDFEAILFEAYQVTNDKNDFVPFEELYDYLKNNGVHDTKSRIGRCLNALNLLDVVKKIDKKATHCRIGIKKI